jgi:pimeloyl-ACP methyl ester carboxylesterase
MPESTERTLNGLRHRLLIWESPGPTLVLLHGFLDLSWSFAPFVEALQRKLAVRVIAPDLRGHGATDWVGAGGYYHFPDYVADVHALLTEVATPRWLLGHSMGGTIAALVAGTFPSLVDRLVLVEGLGPLAHADSSPERMEQWIREVRERRARPARPMPTLEAAQARLMENNHRLKPELARLLAENGTRAVDGGYVWSFDPIHRTRSPLPFQTEQLREFLRRIESPTLLVDGAESGFSIFLEHDRRADEIRKVARATIEEAGHMIHQDQPEALATLVATFLTS